LDPNKFEVTVLTLSPEPNNDSSFALFEMLPISIFCLNLTRLQGVFQAKQKIRTFVESKKPDVIHSQGYRADVLVSSLKFSGKRICTIRNLPQIDYIMKFGKMRGRLMETSHMRAIKKIDLSIGVSQSVCQNLKERYNVKNVDCILNGVDTERYDRIDSEEKHLFRNKLDLPQDAKIWLSVGSLIKRKDPLSLIDCFVEKYHADESVVLLFLGGGELEPVVQKQAEKYKNIICRGQVANVSDYLKAGNFFVSASHAEGLPNTVLEALSCGLPVLLSDIIPHKEIIEMDPLIGKLYLLGDKSSFLEGFDFIEKSDYKKMSDNAYNLAHNELSSKSMSEKYQKLYLS
jgi:glycosyltransferase involved in cell wall biosynthesis